RLVPALWNRTEACGDSLPGAVESIGRRTSRKYRRHAPQPIMSEPAVLAFNPTSPSKEAARARILIADDHPLVRDGLALLISGQHNLTCCGQVGTVAETQILAAKLQPDLIILDLRLKGGDG